jgi:hypothetical protein
MHFKELRSTEARQNHCSHDYHPFQQLVFNSSLSEALLIKIWRINAAKHGLFAGD